MMTLTKQGTQASGHATSVLGGGGIVDALMTGFGVTQRIVSLVAPKSAMVLRAEAAWLSTGVSYGILQM